MARSIPLLGDNHLFATQGVLIPLAVNLPVRRPLDAQGKAVEPFIALLLTVVVACLIGFRSGRRKLLSAQDSEVLAMKYGDYLHAVSAAGLVRLSNVTGETPAREDIEQSIHGSRLISDMIELLEGEHADAVITDMRDGNPDTVSVLLARLSDDAEKYWPERIADIRRARESLS